jgi:hypothetical protein
MGEVIDGSEVSRRDVDIAGNLPHRVDDVGVGELELPDLVDAGVVRLLKEMKIVLCHLMTLE